MPEKKQDSVYLKFIDLGLGLAKSIPRYFSKYSNKIFCNHQHIVLLVLRQKLKMSYRDFAEFLKISNLKLYIGLNRIPHYTTLQKFAKKLKSTILANLGLDCIKLYGPKRNLRLGVDGTGFSLENASKYYSIRACKPTRISTFMQLSIAADLDKQLIAASFIEKRRTIVSSGLIKLVKPATKLNKISYVAADKGYDSNANHEFIIKDLNSRSLIPLRRDSKNPRKWRRKANEQFNEREYHQRSKVETIFSVIKRKYGSILKSRNYSMQKKELLCKLLVYNLDRLVKLTLRIIEGFYTAFWA